MPHTGSPITILTVRSLANGLHAVSVLEVPPFVRPRVPMVWPYSVGPCGRGFLTATTAKFCLDGRRHGEILLQAKALIWT